MDFILREIANNTLDTGFNDQLLEAADYINSLEQRLAEAEEAETFLCKFNFRSGVGR